MEQEHMRTALLMHILRQFKQKLANGGLGAADAFAEASLLDERRFAETLRWQERREETQQYFSLFQWLGTNTFLFQQLFCRQWHHNLLAADLRKPSVSKLHIILALESRINTSKKFLFQNHLLTNHPSAVQLRVSWTGFLPDFWERLNCRRSDFSV